MGGGEAIHILDFVWQLMYIGILAVVLFIVFVIVMTVFPEKKE